MNMDRIRLSGVIRMKHFSDRLMDAVDAKENPSCVGLDPRFEWIPEHLREMCREEFGETLEAVSRCFIEFNRAIIDAVEEVAAVVKPQMAFYEAYGAPGVNAFVETVNHAKRRGMLVIEDAKRGDVGDTAKAYSDGHLGRVQSWSGVEESFDVDAVTVNPYLGFDGIKPFVEDCIRYEKGVFVLVKTSNPSSSQLQDVPTIQTSTPPPELLSRLVADGSVTMEEFGRLVPTGDGVTVTPSYLRTAALVDAWGRESLGARGYSNIGAVVGATYPQEAKVLRRSMPSTYFLVPGYGAQGGSANDATACFNDDGYGAVVSSSRAIAHAYRTRTETAEWPEEEFAEAARTAAIAMRGDLETALKRSGRYPW